MCSVVSYKLTQPKTQLAVVRTRKLWVVEVKAQAEGELDDWCGGGWVNWAKIWAGEGLG